MEPKIVNRSHFYTNAAPTTLEGSVFRYDFMDKQAAPAVNRNLKPKDHQSIPAYEQIETPPPSSAFDYVAPCVDRKLKPTTPKV